MEAGAAAEAGATASSRRDAASGHQGHQQNAGEAEQGRNRGQSERKFPQAGSGLETLGPRGCCVKRRKEEG